MLPEPDVRSDHREPPLVVIEIEGYEGEDGAIVVENYRSLGVRDRLYCIGELGDDGVVRIIDFGYATVEEASKVLSPVERYNRAT
jgi:hypothetical protein